MVEKCERPIARQGCEPQRQSTELDGHGIDVHAEQTPLRDDATKARSITFVELCRGQAAAANQG